MKELKLGHLVKSICFSDLFLIRKSFLRLDFELSQSSIFLELTQMSTSVIHLVTSKDVILILLSELSDLSDLCCISEVITYFCRPHYRIMTQLY